MVGKVVPAPGLTSMTSRLQARLLAQRSLFQRLQSSKKRGKLQAGFTLIELLIVVVIIGILSSIALPNFLSQRERAENAAGDAWASTNARACAAAIITDDDKFKPSERPKVGAGREDKNEGDDCPDTFKSVSGSSWEVEENGNINFTPAGGEDGDEED
jgi:prepilin-type N-terminal cleavage/methylation domain-containing protein